MISKILAFFSYIRSRIQSHRSIGTTLTPPIIPIEDRSQVEAVEAFQKDFKKQERAMSIRALKPHSATCRDPIGCKKSKCFVFVPDMPIDVQRLTVEEYKEQSRKKNHFKHINPLDNNLCPKHPELSNCDTLTHEPSMVSQIITEAQIQSRPKKTKRVKMQRIKV